MPTYTPPHTPSPTLSPKKSNTLHDTIYGISSPFLYTIILLFLIILFQWPRRWLLSGSPLLSLTFLLGSHHGYRVFPSIPLWSLVTSLDLIYAICSTSWLLYLFFSVACYISLFLICLYQFNLVAIFVRQKLRAALHSLHFIDDRIAFFDLPALEIDTEVDGLMVLRGITFQVSTLSFVVHGVEVGIKLSDDMELAIQCEEVVVKLFRGVEIGDCFANLKGGAYEMTFGEVKGTSEDDEGDQVFRVGTE